MEHITPPPKTVSLAERFNPRAGVRAQLIAAALLWAVGASILLVRGFGYISDRYWHSWALAAALVLGVLKARFLLDRVARKAVARINERGRACFFGFFSFKSWIFVIVMMGGGILLRHSGLWPGLLGAIYVGIGTALVIADRIFWRAVFRTSIPVVES